jgi:heptose-I-phosphate ethanolaminephosphotransferase
LKNAKIKEQQASGSIYTSIVKTLLILYPAYLVALVLFPPIVGMFTNYELVDTRQIGILLAWIPVLTLPFLLSRFRIFYYIVVLLCFVIGFVNLGHWILIKTPVTVTGLFVMFNTNLEEALGFATAKNSLAYGLVIPYFVLFFLALRYPPKPNATKGRIPFMVAAVVGLVTISFIAENAINKRFIRKGTPYLVQIVMAYKDEVTAFQNLRNESKMRSHQVAATATPSEKPQTIILILGESTNRNHMSLYGYHRNTNPLLSTFQDLIVYQNVVSGYAHTMKSVPASLSFADLDNQLRAPETVTLAEVFQAANYKTYWLSNQAPIGIWDNMITLFAEQYETVQFVNASGNNSYETLLSNSYDEKLLQPLSNALYAETPRKFIVVHLLGAHLNYDKRYPPTFNVFNNDSSSQKQTIAAYDNAVLYNDFVVDSMLKMIRDYSIKENASCAVIYTSDHGENVYDSGDNLGHDFATEMPKCLVEIPFMAWLSPEYKKQFPQKAALVYAHRSLPFVTDDLFHALIDLSGIQTKIFNPKESVFNSEFNRERKRILTDGKDYDRE